MSVCKWRNRRGAVNSANRLNISAFETKDSLAMLSITYQCPYTGQQDRSPASY